jgi:hypothetical protein
VGFPLVGQQPVDLLDRVLGRQPARQRQTMSDRTDRKRAGADDPQSCVGQRLDALGMDVAVEQSDQGAVNMSEREWLWLSHHRVPRIVVVGETIRGSPGSLQILLLPCPK